MSGTRENYFRTSDDAILYFEDHGAGKPIVSSHLILVDKAVLQKVCKGIPFLAMPRTLKNCSIT